MGDIADWMVEQFDYDTHTPKTCKYCGKQDLYWDIFNGKWKLFEGDEVHHCHPLLDKTTWVKQ
jgi:hypothetical protein